MTCRDLIPVMTRIDLVKYAVEFAAFVELAETFVDGSSALRLDDALRQLRLQVDDRKSRLAWATEREITIKASTEYDGPNRTFPQTYLKCGFNFMFGRDIEAPRADPTWRIERAATHIKLLKDGYEYPFHFDYKNMVPEPQWGPQAHFQVAEGLCDFPIPRLPTTVFLPSDCLDLILAELHPVEWRTTQKRGENRAHLASVRKGQEARTLAYVAEIRRIWEQDKSVTRVVMLQNFTSSLNLLPGHA
jgi:hypothetical protein